MKQKREYWRTLDNAAKLFTAASNKRDTRVFRFYCELKEEVVPEVLQQALDRTVEVYPVFLSVLRKGLFWHYLEKSNLRPMAVAEHREPCGSLYVRDRKELLFEVSYYKNRINFEVFHALTDGTGATEFLRELVKNYLFLVHEKDGLENVVLHSEDVTLQDQEDDGFVKYYSNKKYKKEKKPRAYQLRRRHKELGALQVQESVVSVQAVLKRSRELGVSMTVFLTAVLIAAIHGEMSRLQEKRPVVLMVPVNLRKFFPSESMLNFFNWIEPGYKFGDREDTFDVLLESIKQYFKDNLTKEKMEAHINELFSLEVHPLLRWAPLELKNLCIHAGARFSEKDVTAILSNMSAVQIPAEYAAYIDRFGVYTSTPKLELCLCSFQDKLSIGFTSRFDTTNIQRNFYRILKEQGIEAEDVTSEFPEPDVPRELEWKVFKGFTFLCLAVAILMLIFWAEGVRQWNWPLLVIGGTATMWLDSAFAFFKRYHLLKNAMWQLLIVTGVCILWDVGTGWRGWSIDFVLPVVSIVILISMLVISIVQKYAAKEYMIYFVMAAGYGMILPLILVLTGAVTLKLPSLCGAAFCFLFLVAMIMFKGKEFREEMEKKFHV